MRPARAAAAALATSVLLALPAQAKEGVRAHLLEPVDLKTPAGETLTVRWRLEDAEGHHFGAGGIYLRVFRCGAKPKRVNASEFGSGYRATFKVPRKRIRRLVVGLEGWRIYPSGRRERADAFFEFDPPLKRRCRR